MKANGPPLTLWMAVPILLSIGVGPASAVPVFSRKYQTSCMTCHTVFPKLNPFGEAFRLNGYRLPAQTEDQIKEKPVSLGADAYKRLWPKMVYPSDLPGGAPFALNMKMAMLYVLVFALSILCLSGWASIAPYGASKVNNGGPHGLSEIVYAYVSGTGNNGSAFAGLSGTTTSSSRRR